MTIELKDLIEQKKISETMIKREQFNIQLYEDKILRIVNENLIYTKLYAEHLDTVDTFLNFVQPLKLKNVSKFIQNNNEGISYEFEYNKNKYRIYIPICYKHIEDLKYIIENDNYSKFRFYKYENSHCLSMIGYFKDISDILNILKKE